MLPEVGSADRSFDNGKKAKKISYSLHRQFSILQRFTVHFVAKNLIRIRKTATNGVLPKVAVFFVFCCSAVTDYSIDHNQSNTVPIVLRLYRNTFYTEYFRVNVAETHHKYRQIANRQHATAGLTLSVTTFIVCRLYLSQPRQVRLQLRLARFVCLRLRHCAV